MEEGLSHIIEDHNVANIVLWVQPTSCIGDYNTVRGVEIRV